MLPFNAKVFDYLRFRATLDIRGGLSGLISVAIQACFIYI